MAKSRSGSIIQAIINTSVQGERYYSDNYEAYQTVLYWPAEHSPMDDKSETYSVEAENAELRHYLARLARRSRCFSRCIEALSRAVKLLIYAWNGRQLLKRRYPKYPAHVMEFTYPPS